MPAAKIDATAWNAIRIAVVTGAMTMREAAQKLDVSVNTIKTRSARNGWFKTTPKVPVSPAAVENETVVQKLETVVQKLETKVSGLQGISAEVSREREKTREKMIIRETSLKPAVPEAGESPKTEITARGVAQIITDDFAENKKRFRGGMGRALAKGAEAMALLSGPAILEAAPKVSALAKAGRDTFGSDEMVGANVLIGMAFLRELDPDDSEAGEVIDI